MPQIGFAFSGPGSALPQAGRDLYNKVLPVREAMDKADKLFAPQNFKVTKACFLGGPEELSRPSVAGPATLAIAYGLCAALKAKRVLPQMITGYGWGELNALAGMGCLPFEDALLFLRARGLILEEAWAAAPFHVAGIAGLGAAELELKFAPLPRRPLVVADDSPDACVVAGPEELLKKLLPLLAGKGVKCGMILPGWAWPHPIFESVKPAIEAAFSRLPIERAGPWQIFGGGLDVSAPLAFRETAAAMRAAGMDTLVEIGPSEALGAYTRKQDTGVRALATLDTKALSSALKLAV
jgi:acyl transferase domain-containing protein